MAGNKGRRPYRAITSGKSCSNVSIRCISKSRRAARKNPDTPHRIAKDTRFLAVDARKVSGRIVPSAARKSALSRAPPSRREGGSPKSWPIRDEMRETARNVDNGASGGKAPDNTIGRRGGTPTRRPMIAQAFHPPTSAGRTFALSSRSAAVAGSSIPSCRPSRMAFSRMTAAISQILRSAPGPNLLRKERATA